MQFVSAGLDGKIRYAGLSAAVLRADGAGLHFEFADRLGAGTEFIVTAALQIKASERHPFDQDFVRVVLPAIDRTLKRAADRAGQAGKDELLNLPLPVGNRDGPRVEFFLRHVATDFGRTGFEQRRLIRDGDSISNRTGLQFEIHRQGLRHQHIDIVGNGGLEAVCADADFIGADGQIRQPIDTGIGRGRARILTCSDVGSGHVSVRHDCAGSIGDDAVDCAALALRERTEGK